MKDYEIIWAEEALSQLNIITKSIGKHWSLNEIADFVEKVKNRENTISRNPEAFPLIKPSEGIRKTVINKKTIILYVVSHKSESVEIVSVSDARQDQSNLNF